jgi:hypothetical protein
MWLLWPLLLLLLKDGEEGGDEEEDEREDDGEGEDEDEEIRDPKALIKSLREANARLAKKLEKKDQRIQELEARDGDGIRSARLESAFIRAVFEYRDSIDLEAAWDLASLKGYLDGVKVEDNGSVDSDEMEKALGKLVARYPYLIDDKGEEPASDDGRTPPKTRQPRQKQKAKTAVDRAALEKRFPALRSRRRPF